MNLAKSKIIVEIGMLWNEVITIKEIKKSSFRT